MNELVGTYLTTIQYNKICKYWRIINKISYKLKNFDYSKYKYYAVYLDACSDDNEYNDEKFKCIEHNKKIDNCIGTLETLETLEALESQLDYYQKEYEKYIGTIGFELNDQTQDEILFNLLNNGIELNYFVLIRKNFKFKNSKIYIISNI